MFYADFYTFVDFLQFLVDFYHFAEVGNMVLCINYEYYSSLINTVTLQ